MHEDAPTLQARVFLLGDVVAERRSFDGLSWEKVPSEVWGTDHNAARLVGFLCCHRRRVKKSFLYDALWPDEERSETFLSNVFYRVRKALSKEVFPSYQRTVITLAPQSVLWTDVDHCIALMDEVERIGHTTPQGRTLLEEAATLFERGEVLEEETEVWCYAWRQEIETLAHRCFLWLAEAYEAQGEPRHAEKLLHKLLRKDPTDEQALSLLMSLLQKQGQTHDAIKWYQKTSFLLEQMGLPFPEEIQSVAQHIQKEGRRATHQGTALYISSSVDREQEEMFAHEELQGLLERLSKALSRQTNVDKATLTYVEACAEKHWQNHNEGVVTSHQLLYNVTQHLHTVLSLLEGSLSFSTRVQLYSTVSSTALLCGALLFDLGYYGKARELHTFALKAAQEGDYSKWEAVAWGLIGLSWFYDGDMYQALACIQQGRCIAVKPISKTVSAWLAAIEAEIQAKLGHHDACLDALDAAILPQYWKDDSYCTGYDSTRMEGYRGACLKLLYNPRKADTIRYLTEAQSDLLKGIAQSSTATHDTRSIYLCDLASTYILQKEIEGVCTLTMQAVTANTRHSQMVIQRVLSVRKDLDVWHNTRYVKELDALLTQKHLIDTYRR